MRVCTISGREAGRRPIQIELVSFGKSGETPVIEGSASGFEVAVKLAMEDRHAQYRRETTCRLGSSSTLMCERTGPGQEQQYYKHCKALLGLKSGDMTILYEDSQSKLNFIKETSG
jgi:hypothetical protein